MPIQSYRDLDAWKIGMDTNHHHPPSTTHHPQPDWVMCRAACPGHNRPMLTEFSNQLADAAAAAAPSVVQVQGRRRAASGIVYAQGTVVTTVQALGREDGLHVRGSEGDAVDAELAAWDPATSLAVLKAPALVAPAIQV